MAAGRRCHYGVGIVSGVVLGVVQCVAPLLESAGLTIRRLVWWQEMPDAFVLPWSVHWSGVGVHVVVGAVGCFWCYVFAACWRRLSETFHPACHYHRCWVAIGHARFASPILHHRFGCERQFLGSGRIYDLGVAVGRFVHLVAVFGVAVVSPSCVASLAAGVLYPWSSAGIALPESVVGRYDLLRLSSHSLACLLGRLFLEW